MSFQAENPSSSRRTIFTIVGLICLVMVAGLFYLLNRPATTGEGSAPRLADALRPGTPEFDQYRDRIFVAEPEATESARAVGDIVMELSSKVSNFTGHTITGLEMRGVVVDPEGQPIRERTLIIIPGRQTELEPNKTVQARIVLAGMKKTDVRANVRMEVTGVKFR